MTFGNCFLFSQDSLLADNPFEGLTLESLPRSPSPLSSAPSTPFPCLADELEEQVKALERDLTLAASPSCSALDQPSSTRLLSPEREGDNKDVVEYQLESPLALQQTAESTYQKDYIRADDVSTAMREPRRSERPTFFENSGKSENATLTKGLVVQHSGQRGAPLAVAVHNADCVRRSVASPWPGAWNGCCISPWCSRCKRHPGACNARASIPGLAAYLPEELAALGLPALPEVSGPLPPAAAMAAENASRAIFAPEIGVGKEEQTSISEYREDQISPSGYDGSRLLFIGKRKADDVAASGNVMVPTSIPSTPTESSSFSDNHSNNGDDNEHANHITPLNGTRTRQATRKRTKGPAGVKSVLSDGSSVTIEEGATTSEEHKSSTTEEMKISLGSNVVNSRNKVRARTGRIARDRRASCNNALAGKGTTTKSGTNRSHGQRRGPQVWISGQTEDPRTGETVAEVPPATFCSQCKATSTPVWRAGPFGHKTLCNACGVRWMKIKPGRK